MRKPCSTKYWKVPSAQALWYEVVLVPPSRPPLSLLVHAWRHELVEGSLDVKLPTRPDEKAEVGRVREETRREEKIIRKKIREEKGQKKEEKGGKVAKHTSFPMFCGPGGSKSRLAKAAGAEPSGPMRDEKLHTSLAGTTFRSQNAQSAPGSEHFWKL